MAPRYGKKGTITQTWKLNSMPSLYEKYSQKEHFCSFRNVVYVSNNFLYAKDFTKNLFETCNIMVKW